MRQAKEDRARRRHDFARSSGAKSRGMSFRAEGLALCSVSLLRHLPSGCSSGPALSTPGNDGGKNVTDDPAEICTSPDGQPPRSCDATKRSIFSSRIMGGRRQLRASRQRFNPTANAAPSDSRLRLRRGLSRLRRAIAERQPTDPRRGSDARRRCIFQQRDRGFDKLDLVGPPTAPLHVATYPEGRAAHAAKIELFYAQAAWRRASPSRFAGRESIVGTGDFGAGKTEEDRDGPAPTAKSVREPRYRISRHVAVAQMQGNRSRAIVPALPTGKRPHSAGRRLPKGAPRSRGFLQELLRQHGRTPGSPSAVVRSSDC